MLPLTPIACSAFQTNPDTASDVVLDYSVMAANSAALAIETAQRTSESTYYVAQKRIVQQSIDERWSDETYNQRISEIRADWKPVWAAFKRARAAHLKLTQAIELGQGVTEAVLGLSTARKDLAAAMAGPDNFAPKEKTP